MSSCYSEPGSRVRSLRLLATLALFAVVACAPDRDPRFDRTPLAPLDPSEFLPRDPIDLAAEDELLQAFFDEGPSSPYASLNACSWLEAYSLPRPQAPRMRMAQDLLYRLQGGRFDVEGTAGRGGGASGLTSKTIIVPLDQNGKKDGRVVLNSLNGRVDVAGNPIYQFGLWRSLRAGQEGKGIPSREEYIRELDREIARGGSFFVDQPLERLKRLALTVGLADFYKIRNEEIAKTIEQSLPGVFDASVARGEVKVYRFNAIQLQSIIFDNALGDVSVALPFPADDVSTTQRKLLLLRRALHAFEKPLPLFRSESWVDYEQETRVGINLGLRGQLSGNPDEQVCGAVLSNRVLGQLLTFMGYVRPPVLQDPARLSSRLPPVTSMLDHPHGTRAMACPIPGVFTQNGVRKLLTEQELADVGETAFDLPKTIPDFPVCDPSLAVADGSWDFRHFRRFYANSTADSDDWLALLRSVSHFVSAFNPGANWWRSGDRSYPLMAVTDLEEAAKTQGILPHEAHALALGILNLGVKQLEKKHIVLLDKNGAETDVTDDAIAIRMSREPRAAKSGGKVTTTLYSATLLAEAAFKFGVSLKKLAEYQVIMEKYRDSLAYERDRLKREKAIANYNAQLAGLFGSQETLNMLTELGDDSVRQLIENLQLASAVLLSGFIKEGPEGRGGRYTCHAEIVNDLDANTEAKNGDCSPRDEERLKNLLRIIARAYGSPLFARYAE